MSEAPPEIYGNILGFLSLEDALNIVKNNTKLAPTALRYYPWDLSQERVCNVFSKANMEMLKYNTNVSSDSLFICGASKGMLDFSKKLLETREISPSGKNKALLVSLEHPDVVKELLKDPRTDPNSIYGTTGEITAHPLVVASETNEDVFKILLAYPSKYPERKLSYPQDVYVSILYNASLSGYFSKVKLIEMYMPVGAVYNNALKISIIHGSIARSNNQIFDFLLDSRKILLTDEEDINPLIDIISERNSVKALKKILKDPRFNDYVYWMMTTGIVDGKIDIVREMLKDPRIKGDDVDSYIGNGRDPDNVYEDESAFTMAIEHYHNHPKEILQIIKLLLKDGRADPSLNNNEHIIIASRYGHLEVVKLLLNDSRVDPSARDYKAINEAYEDGWYINKRSYFDIIKLLANHPKVKYNGRVPTKTLNRIYLAFTSNK